MTMPSKTPARKKPSKNNDKAASHNASEGADKGLDFEQALAQLEQLVDKMEGGDLSLEQSLRAFETGVKLTREAQARLNVAEQRVKMLMEEQDQLVESDFEEQCD